MKKVIAKRSRYVDSVTLMGVSEKARKLEGLNSVDVVMLTKANRELLEGLHFTLDSDLGPNDLVIAVDGEDAAVEKAFNLIEGLLNRGASKGKVFVDLDDAGVSDKTYDIVQISLPGEYAYAEGMKALKKGINVFMFSDNVSYEEEKSLKEYAYAHNLLCMGPDCGVASIGGLCLGAGSILPTGKFGIVGASGSGAQEVACMISEFGEGISSLIGTGGRDLTPQIGGLMMKMGMHLLDEDSATEVIVLVSKLASIDVMADILKEADTLKKPTVSIFLGSDMSIYKGHKVIGAISLQDAAIKALEAAGHKVESYTYSDSQLDEIANREVNKYNKNQKYIRGLYCGGTFTEEGLIYYKANCKDKVFYSNLETKYTTKLASKDISFENSILDMGAEDFTAALPHPIFEPNLRLRRLENELDDNGVAIITLDFITGPGVHEDPVTSFIEAIRKHRKESLNYVTFIVNICGSKLDPQNTVKIKEDLVKEGVIVTHSNYETAKLAAKILNKIQ